MKIRPISPPFCLKCGRRVANIDFVCDECSSKDIYIEESWSCCYYEGTIKECIHLFKYRGYMGLSDIFESIMTGFIKKHNIGYNIDLVVPVPIHSSKKRDRNYDHVGILARLIAANMEIPVDLKNLKKLKWTRSQSELDRENRLHNLKDSFFAVDKNAFQGKNILLVDDVYTTGTTINECAKILLGAKAGSVSSLTIARGN